MSSVFFFFKVLFEDIGVSRIFFVVVVKIIGVLKVLVED